MNNTSALSIVTVNYNSTRYFEELLASIELVEFPSNFIREIIVVDNGSRPTEVAALKRLEHKNLIKIILDKETSFSAANNIAFAKATAPYIAILNPDTLVKDRSFQIMVEYLQENGDISAIGPKLWFDKKQSFVQLPVNRNPGLLSLIVECIQPWWPELSERAVHQKSRRAATLLEAESPVKINWLCGACIITSEKTLSYFGGFDERFPLYFEDTDWCRNIDRRGGKLVHHPHAGIVHLFNKSSGQNYQRALGKAVISERAYFKKHYFLLGSALLTLRDWTKKFTTRGPIKAPHINDIGLVTLPFEYSVSDPTVKYAEVALSRDFKFSAYMLVKDKTITFERDSWRDFCNQDIFVRVIPRLESRPLTLMKLQFRESL